MQDRTFEEGRNLLVGLEEKISYMSLYLTGLGNLKFRFHRVY